MEWLQSIIIWFLQKIHLLLQKVIDIFWEVIQFIQDSSWDILNKVWIFLDPIKNEFLDLLPLLMEIGQLIFTLKIIVMGIIFMYPSSRPFQGGPRGLRRYWWAILTDIRWTASFIGIMFIIWLFKNP